MDILSFLLEIVRQVPIYVCSGVGFLGFGLCVGFKIGTFRDWINERALTRALQHKLPKMIKEED